jgi:hypothetical protein
MNTVAISKDLNEFMLGKKKQWEEQTATNTDKGN